MSCREIEHRVTPARMSPSFTSAPQAPSCRPEELRAIESLPEIPPAGESVQQPR